MTVFQGAVDGTFAAFGIDAVYTPAGGEPAPVRVIAGRPDAIVGFGETRIPPRPPARARAISSRSAPRPSLSRASRSGPIRIGWSGASM
jgi:hypothetical protein